MPGSVKPRRLRSISGSEPGLPPVIAGFGTGKTANRYPLLSGLPLLTKTVYDVVRWFGPLFRMLKKIFLDSRAIYLYVYGRLVDVSGRLGELVVHDITNQ